MNSKFQELKNKFKQQQESKKKSDGNQNRKNDIYPFWEMQEGDVAVVRILPDKDAENNPNPFPISVPLFQHRLHINGKERKIPSLETWGESDPIAELSQKYYAEGDKEKGRYYWRKRTDILRALIVKDPLPVDETTGEKAEGKVKTLYFSWQLMEALNTAIADDEIQVEPWDLEKGYNFKIVKSAMPGKDENGKKQYTYAIGSGFERNSSDISNKNIELVDLKTLLPKKPSLEVIERMLNAHLTGADYDDDATDDAASDSTADTGNVKAEPITPKTEVKAEPAKVVEETKTEATTSEDDDDAVIAAIMARRKNQAK